MNHINILFQCLCSNATLALLHQLCRLLLQKYVIFINILQEQLLQHLLLCPSELFSGRKMYDPSADGSSSMQTKNFRPYHNDIISVYYLTAMTMRNA